MVSESLARYLWPSGDAVGRRLIAIGAEAESDDVPSWQTVVGVVEDARYRELERGRFNLYVPFTQVSMSLNHLVIRTQGDPAGFAAALQILESLANTEVLVMDDCGLAPFTADNRHDPLEVLEDSHGVRSTVVTSQLLVDKWHDVVGDRTLADAILDRLVHNAYKQSVVKLRVASRAARRPHDKARRKSTSAIYDRGATQSTLDASPLEFQPGFCHGLTSSI